MKTLFISACIIFSLVISGIGFIHGAYRMAYTLLYDKSEFFQSFEIFSLSAILLFVSITSFLIVRILANTDLLMSGLSKLMNTQRDKPNIQAIRLSPIQMDETMDENLSKVFGTLFGHLSEKSKQTEGDKKLEDMTLEELKDARNKAIEKQDYEGAAKIREIINKKEQ